MHSACSRTCNCSQLISWGRFSAGRIFRGFLLLSRRISPRFAARFLFLSFAGKSAQRNAPTESPSEILQNLLQKSPTLSAECLGQSFCHAISSQQTPSRLERVEPAVPSCKDCSPLGPGAQPRLAVSGYAGCKVLGWQQAVSSCFCSFAL